MNRIESAIVLVGGGGTRLRPLSYSIAKPLIPVFNRPLITYLMDNLRLHGVTNIILAAAASDRSMEAALGKGEGLGVSLSYSYEETPLGSGLAVKQAAAGLTDPFFVCNGDIVTDLDLSSMAGLHMKSSALLSIALASVDDPTGFGVAELGNADRLIRFVEKPSREEAPSNWANAGTWIFDPRLLNYVPDVKRDGSLERIAFPDAIAHDENVQGFCSSAYWMDVGTIARYVQLHNDLAQGRFSPFDPQTVFSNAGDAANNTTQIGTGSSVHAAASLSGLCTLGKNCQIDSDVTLSNSILWEAVHVGRGARLENCVLGDRCWIGEGVVLEDVVLANDVTILQGATVPPCSRIEPGQTVEGVWNQNPG